MTVTVRVLGEMDSVVYKTSRADTQCWVVGAGQGFPPLMGLVIMVCVRVPNPLDTLHAPHPILQLTGHAEVQGFDLVRGVAHGAPPNLGAVRTVRVWVCMPCGLPLASHEPEQVDQFDHSLMTQSIGQGAASHGRVKTIP